MRTDRQTDRHDESNNFFVILRKRLKRRELSPITLLSDELVLRK